ncbi:MAG: hypothetical protein U0P82_08290 [Vicinamibacterales bacterium]
MDNRPRWAGVACAPNGQVGGCVNRINNDPGNQVTANYVLKNDNSGHAWNFAETLSKTTSFGLSVRGAYSYGKSRNDFRSGVDGGNQLRAISNFADPNNPGTSISLWSPGHRVFAVVNYA